MLPAAVGLFATLLLGTAQEEIERSSTSPPTLETAQIEVRLDPEGAGAHVRVTFGVMGLARGEDVKLLALASLSEIGAVEAGDGRVWLSVALDEVRAGRVEAVWNPPLSPDPGPVALTLRYRAPEAQVRAEDGSVESLRVPILAPAGLAGTGGSGSVEIHVASEHPLRITRLFPSGLRLREGSGEWHLEGTAPAVPGVVRFGPGNPMDVASSERPPGLAFWGLWVALAALLSGYVAWMRRAESRSGGPA